MKLQTEKINKCAEWVKENGLIDNGGASVMQFCKAMDIHKATFYRWMDNNSDFRDAIKRAKEYFANNLEDELVETLTKAAKGYTYTKRKTIYKEDVNGKPYIYQKQTEEVEVSPNIGAAIFLLTNIAPERWKSRITNDVDAKIKGDIDNNVKYDLQQIPEDLLYEVADKLQESQHDKVLAEKEKG